MASVSKREWTYKGETKSAWVVRYQEGGKHRSKQFDKKKQADTFKQQVEREIFEGRHVTETDAPLIKTIALQYLKAEENRLKSDQISPSHFRNIRIYVELCIIPYLGERKLHQLRGGDIEDWIHKLCKDRGLSIRTARRRLGELGRVSEYAIQRGMLKINPVPAVFKRLRPGPRVPISTFTEAQIVKLLGTSDVKGVNKHPRAFMLLRAVVPLAAMCGLRWGEIFGLTAKHLNLTERRLEVRHSLTHYDELRPPKTAAGVRNVPVPDYVAERLEEWLVAYPPNNDRGLIFASREGRGMTPGSFRRWYWLPLLDRAGLLKDDDPYHFHALRHFASSLMIARGLPLTDTASLLGHNSFDMTLQVYAHPIVGGNRRVEVLNHMANSLFTPVP